MTPQEAKNELEKLAPVDYSQGEFRAEKTRAFFDAYRRAASHEAGMRAAERVLLTSSRGCQNEWEYFKRSTLRSLAESGGENGTSLLSKV